jgi:hypothetical protein
MWLAYLRFDSRQDTRIAFVECANKAEAEEVKRVARKVFGRGLTEFVGFYSGRKIHAKTVPAFAEELIFSYDRFLKACGVTPGQPSPPSDAPPQHPPGSLGQAASPALLDGLSLSEDE